MLHMGGAGLREDVYLVPPYASAARRLPVR